MIVQRKYTQHLNILLYPNLSRLSCNWPLSFNLTLIMDVRVKILIIYFLHLVCQLVVACTPQADVTPRAVQAKVFSWTLMTIIICINSWYGVVLCKYVCMYVWMYVLCAIEMEMANLIADQMTFWPKQKSHYIFKDGR